MYKMFLKKREPDVPTLWCWTPTFKDATAWKTSRKNKKPDSVSSFSFGTLTLKILQRIQVFLVEARWCSGQAWRALDPLTRVRISPGLPSQTSLYNEKASKSVSFRNYFFCMARWNGLFCQKAFGGEPARFKFTFKLYK